MMKKSIDNEIQIFNKLKKKMKYLDQISKIEILKKSKCDENNAFFN
jgi:hypothetical protein